MNIKENACTRILANKARELAFEYERTIGACAQPVIRALQEVFGEEDDLAFKGLTGFSAGGANQIDGICGAYAAGVFYLSQKVGRSLRDFGKDEKDNAAISKLYDNFALVKQFRQKFREEYNTVICENIMRKLYGRSYNIEDADEFKKFDECGAHDWAETGVCGNAAYWVVEILQQNGLAPREE